MHITLQDLILANSKLILDDSTLKDIWICDLLLSARNFSIEGPPLLRPIQCCVKVAADLYVPTRGLFDAIFPNNSVFNVGVRIAHDRLSKILQAMTAMMGRHMRMLRPVPNIVDRMS